MNTDSLDIAKTPKPQKTIRVWEIDFLRGILILLMVFDHFAYDWAYIVNQFFAYNGSRPPWVIDLINIAQNYWLSDYRIIIRFIVLCLFFLISGISCYFSKNNLKRGLIILGFGIILTIGSLIFSEIVFHNYSEIMFFGAISCFGVSILIYYLIHFLTSKWLETDKYWKYFALGLGLAFVFVGFLLNNYNPSAIGTNSISWDNWFLIVLGVKTYGSDTLGLFPMVGFLFLGGFLGEILYTNKIRSKRIKFDKVATLVTYPINFFGKHSLWVYIFHQVVNIAIIGIILLCNGFYIKF